MNKVNKELHAISTSIQDRVSTCIRIKTKHVREELLLDDFVLYLGKNCLLSSVAAAVGSQVAAWSNSSVMLGHACEMLAVMYLQRGPPIAENETTTHRTHRTVSIDFLGTIAPPGCNRVPTASQTAAVEINTKIGIETQNKSIRIVLLKGPIAAFRFFYNECALTVFVSVTVDDVP
jgi:hypothetical protein